MPEKVNDGGLAKKEIDTSTTTIRWQELKDLKSQVLDLQAKLGIAVEALKEISGPNHQANSWSYWKANDALSRISPKEAGHE